MVGMGGFPLKSHSGGKNKNLGGSVPCLPLKYKYLPWPPAFIYFIKDDLRATYAVRLLTPLNLRSKTTYASQPPQPPQPTIYIYIYYNSVYYFFILNWEKLF